MCNNKNKCCGTCDFYDEWANGYCESKKKFVEPENESCEEYMDSNILYDLLNQKDI